MGVAGGIAIAVLVSLLAGMIGSMLASKEDPATVAGVCAGAILGTAYLVVIATTPQSECGNTGCDTGYGIGVIVMFFPVFGVTLAGVGLARLLRRRTARRSSQ